MALRTTTMQLSAPHRKEPVQATPQAIVDFINELPGKEYPFAVLGGSDELRFIQTWWTPSGFILEFQEGSVADSHFRCVREDLSVDEVITAFKTYLDWQARPRFEYRKIEVRTFWYRLGYRTGVALGMLWRTVRPSRRPRHHRR
jgi:hypothetical protein